MSYRNVTSVCPNCGRAFAAGLFLQDTYCKECFSRAFGLAVPSAARPRYQLLWLSVTCLAGVLIAACVLLCR